MPVKHALLCKLTHADRHLIYVDRSAFFLSHSVSKPRNSCQEQE